MKKSFLSLLLCGAVPLGGCALFGASGSSNGISANESSVFSSALGSSFPGASGAFSSSSGASSDNASTLSSPASSGVTPAADFLAFWDDAVNLKISLTFSDASLSALSHYGANDNQKWGDLYFPADLVLESGAVKTTILDVGVRMRGNTSRQEICGTDGVIYQPCHLKISFKATFDDDLYDLSQFVAFKHTWTASALSERKDRDFLGMEKMDLKYLPRNVYDQVAYTYSQEIYVYDRFRAAGIMAPYAKWSTVTLTDPASAYTCAYEVIEDIDKPFLKKRTADDKGDLYKCVWGASEGTSAYTGADLARSGAVTSATNASGYDCGTRIATGRIGVEDNYNGYHPCYQLKTNDSGEASDFSKMANYIDMMATCRYNKGTQDMLNRVLEVDEFLKMEAISYLFGNFDDQRNNANNYFLYFAPMTGKATYIPYDWDWCLGADCGNDVVSWLPLRTAGLDGSQIPTNVYWDTFLSGSSYAPSYDLAAMRATYLGYVRSFLGAGYLDKANYASFLTQQNSSCVKNDLANVQNYMEAKKALLLGYFQ